MTSVRGWCTTHISSRQERPESVCMCSLCICRALMEGVSARQQHTVTKHQKNPCSGCAMPWSSAVSAHCGWGSSEALLGRAASSGLSVLALGKMLPISHVSSGIISPSQGNCFVPPEKAASSPHRSEISWIPALLECLLSWLSAQWPYSWFLAGHAPLFPALVVQSISR